MELVIKLTVTPPYLSCTITTEDGLSVYLNNGDKGFSRRLIRVIQDFVWVACLDRNRFNGERLYVKTLNEMTYNTYRSRKVRARSKDHEQNVPPV